MAAPNEITTAQLSRLIGTPDCPVIVDVRIDEDFEQDPRLIPGAIRHPHSDIESLAPELMGKRVIVPCHKGLKISQGAAALLRLQGIAAETVKGGFVQWVADGHPVVQPGTVPTNGGLWVTRHRPKIDRIACPWLIRRFVDRSARFLFVSPGQVLNVAEKFDAIPFDIPECDWTHRGEHCTFDALLQGLGLRHPALDHMARIVRAADTDRLADEPEAAGLLAVSLGLSRMYRDDLEQLEKGLEIYDALFRWARDATGETHIWETGK